MYPGPLLSQSLKDAHQQALQTIAAPGPSWTGAERVAMVAEARSSLDCGLCQQRKNALTPTAHTGTQLLCKGLKVVSELNKLSECLEQLPYKQFIKH